MIEYEGLKIRWLGHDGFLIENSSGKTVVIDPFKVTGNFKPVDVVVSTHEHSDHCSLDDMRKFVSSNTEVIGIPMAKNVLERLSCKKINYVKPGEKLTINSIIFEFVPAYNINKFRDPKKGIHFHPKNDNKIGIIIEMDGHRLYHAGDTDNIPEMKNIRVEIALLPVSGTYVMTADEAIEAAQILKPKLAIPMHFGAIVGDKSMAEKFEKGVSCKVKIPTID